jgi:NhaP-type Na+/H+ or K+/H+ antiporter
MLLGAIIGYGAGRLLLWAEAKQTIEKQSFLAYTVALSLRKTGLESALVVGSLIICASIFAHGFSAVPFAQLYSNRFQSRRVNQ